MTRPEPDLRAGLDALTRELRDAALTVAWRQWRALGGQTAARGEAHAIVDPEALVLLSLALMDDEPRLADILHDWTVLNSGLLSVQRAKNLAGQYPAAVQERIGWLAEIALEEGKDLRWRPLARRSAHRAVAEHGERPYRANKMRAIHVRFASPATLLLRLRVGFGVGAKADILGFLLGVAGQWASVRDIRDATGYTSAAVRRAADDMAAAQFVQLSARQPVRFRADPAAWRDVLAFDDSPPAWRSWQERFVFVAALLAWAKHAASRPLTPYTLGAKGRELLEAHRGAFERDHVAIWSEHTIIPDWAPFLRNAVGSLASWMVANT